MKDSGSSHLFPLIYCTKVDVVSLMSYWVFPKSGIPITRKTVQRETHLGTQTDANRKRSNTVIHLSLRDSMRYTHKNLSRHRVVTSQPWKCGKTLPMATKTFRTSFSIVFDNTDVKEDDNQFTLYSCDNYINMELALD